ncbi:hypothetical protein BGW80DRAFT_1462029 [Lactifluus volemus]|nr:hypothetical protein BGW80DRAFT_1462029 [Lactifluus volemus]
MFFSLHRDRTPDRAKVTPQLRRQSTTISMLEEELGMCEPPQAVNRFGLPSRLRIIPPKRKHSFTQAPEPRRKASFLKGPWEIVWDCDMDEAYRTESLPGEDVNFLSDEVLGHGEQDCELDRSRDVGTPTGTGDANGETTPTFASHVPTQGLVQISPHNH